MTNKIKIIKINEEDFCLYNLLVFAILLYICFILGLIFVHISNIGTYLWASFAIFLWAVVIEIIIIEILNKKNSRIKVK
jgi:hypothetical protein